MHQKNVNRHRLPLHLRYCPRSGLPSTAISNTTRDTHHTRDKLSATKHQFHDHNTTLHKHNLCTIEKRHKSFMADGIDTRKSTKTLHTAHVTPFVSVCAWSYELIWRTRIIRQEMKKQTAPTQLIPWCSSYQQACTTAPAKAVQQEGINSSGNDPTDLF